MVKNYVPWLGTGVALLVLGGAAVLWSGRGRELPPAEPAKRAGPVTLAGGPPVPPSPAGDVEEAEEVAETPVESDPEFVPARHAVDYASWENEELCRDLIRAVQAGGGAAINALSAELVVRGDEAVPFVERLLQSGIPAVEVVALRVLVGIGSSRSVAAGLARMCREPQSDSQPELAKVLGQLPSPEVARAVVDMVALEHRPAYRDNLYAVLTAMEGGAIVEAMARRLAAESDEQALRPWLQALSRLSKPSNVEGLENLFMQDAREAVQRGVAFALAGIGDQRACWFLAACGAESASCREALASVRSPYAQAVLQEIAGHAEVAPEVRAAARHALKSIN